MAADPNGSIRLCSRAVFVERLERFESWLWSRGPAALGLGEPPSIELLAERVVELSDLYTTDRAGVARAARHRSHDVAKAFYFLCSDAPKVRLVLEELAARQALPAADGRPLRWSDLGCGLGATSVGALLALDGTEPLAIDAIDHDGDALAFAHAALRAAATIAQREASVSAAEGDLLAAPVADGSSFVLCQSAINEVTDHVAADGDEPPAALVDAAARWCASSSCCVLLEPALRLATRPLHRLRDRLLERGAARVLAPCPHAAACPMLGVPRHWCHEVRVMTPTPRVAAVQARTRRRDERTKFSFVALAPGLGRSSAPAGGPAWPADALLAGRLVSDPLRSKGKTERLVCTTTGELVRLRLLDRERTEANAALADLRRGALVAIEGCAALPRVGPDAAVRRLA